MIKSNKQSVAFELCDRVGGGWVGYIVGGGDIYIQPQSPTHMNKRAFLIMLDYLIHHLELISRLSHYFLIAIVVNSACMLLSIDLDELRRNVRNEMIRRGML